MIIPEETSYRFEPCLLGNVPMEIADLIAELITSVKKLDTNLHPRTAATLANLIRIMNCYYSNLIEGHNTKPLDIERALTNDFDQDELKRDLQTEAKAHVCVQKNIDGLYEKNG